MSEVNYIVIDVTSSGEIRSHYEAVGIVDAVHHAGGFCATAILPAYREHWHPLHIPMIPDEGIMAVLWSSDQAKEAEMSDEDISAVLAHEEGHIVHQDVTLDMIPEGQQFLNFIHKEIRADAYAAQRYGARVVSRALMKIIKLFSTAARKEDPEFRLLEKLRETDIPKRLKALRESGY